MSTQLIAIPDKIKRIAIPASFVEHYIKGDLLVLKEKEIKIGNVNTGIIPRGGYSLKEIKRVGEKRVVGYLLIKCTEFWNFEKSGWIILEKEKEGKIWKVTDKEPNAFINKVVLTYDNINVKVEKVSGVYDYILSKIMIEDAIDLVTRKKYYKEKGTELILLGDIRGAEIIISYDSIKHRYTFSWDKMKYDPGAYKSEIVDDLKEEEIL